VQGKPATGKVVPGATGSATRGGIAGKTASGKPSSSRRPDEDDEEEKRGNKLINALKNYNRP
jgi:hypothetical protein